jgi:hypothetical protein
MVSSGLSKGLLLSLGMMGSLAGCEEAPAEPAGQAAQLTAADADIYGVDGNETVNGIAFVSAQSIFDRLAKGEIGCFRYDQNDATCTGAFYARAVLASAMEMQIFYLEANYTAKQVLPYRTELKGKYLCETTTEENIANWTLYYTRNNIPKLSTEDTVVETNVLETWRDSNRRRLAATLGMEYCYRFSQVTEGGNPVPGVFYQYTFIDGMMQPQREMVELSMFNGADLEALRLRPA